MAIKDELKNINLDVLQDMEIRARTRILEATKMRRRRMREEGIKHDEKMSNIELIPYRDK